MFSMWDRLSSRSFCAQEKPVTDWQVRSADFFNGPPQLCGSKWVVVGVADFDGDSGEPLAEAGGERGEHRALAGPVTQGDGRATDAVDRQRIVMADFARYDAIIRCKRNPKRK